MTTAQDSQQLHLIVDLHGGGVTPAPASARRFDTLTIPPGVSYLVAGGVDGPRVQRDAAAPALAAVLEPIFAARRLPRLLFMRPRAVFTRVNGDLPPRVALFAEGDHLLFADHSLHLAVFNHPTLGHPVEELIGKRCPVCRVPFTPATRVFFCVCQTAYHLEDEGAEQDRLRCAEAVSECCVCHRPIVLSQGYSSWPQEVSHE